MGVGEGKTHSSALHIPQRPWNRLGSMRREPKKSKEGTRESKDSEDLSVAAILVEALARGRMTAYKGQETNQALCRQVESLGATISAGALDPVVSVFPGSPGGDGGLGTPE